jgi:2-alkenal reductase
VVAIESTKGGSELYGSGFFWDNQGHIVTNIHVLGQDSTVVLANGQRVKPEVIGYDATYDVAVIRVPFSSRLMGHGSSRSLRVGEPVFAIGNPYGVGISLSRGIVSGVNRSIETTERRKLFNLLQTDAALNPGNSGGPLIDQRGCLVGMNTAILSPSSTSSGVGFALTVEQLTQVIPGILNGRSNGVAEGTTQDVAPVAKPVGYGAPNYSQY